jgi:hypothetical protein
MTNTALDKLVERTVASTPVRDIHTHLYDPAFGDMLLWGIDDLLVYHYAVAEAFRYFEMPYEKFWGLPKSQQAGLVWDALFIRHSPLSEACRGVLTSLHRLGLDVKKRDLPALRQWFARQNRDDHIDRCLELANVTALCTTNSPFDDRERAVWRRGFRRDSRFTAALRIDPLLLDWNRAGAQLRKDGYQVGAELTKKTVAEVRRFLADWTKRMDAQYVMVSLPPDFAYPARSVCAQLIERAVLPHCAQFNVPFAMMPGVKRAVNPLLRLAGDGVGLSNLDAYETMIAAHPGNKFLITALARENQHQLCVMARKFRNLHVFGCWWFTNIPSLIDEITRMRLELIGLSFTPQHSDARVLEQLIYKWDHSRVLITAVLREKYRALAATGWQIEPAEIQRDVRALFGGAFETFLEKSL